MRLTNLSLGIAFGLLTSVSAFAAEAIDTKRLHPKAAEFEFEGPFGKYDRGALQRGYQVYKEVCAACHAANLLAFHNLAEPGGPGFSEAQARALATAAKVPAEPNDKGETTDDKGTPLMRSATLADRFPSPFPNDIAARAANNNALPPDLSLITKAREGGAAYVHSLLTGYTDANTYRNEEGKTLPAEARPPSPNLHFNPYFANLNIAMPPPLTSAGQVTYAPGNPAPTVDQMATDVAAFLVWTGEPNLASRHAAGIAVSIFLLIASILGYFAYRQIWYEAKRAVRVTGALEPENQAKSKRAKSKQGIAG